MWTFPNRVPHQYGQTPSLGSLGQYVRKCMTIIHILEVNSYSIAYRRLDNFCFHLAGPNHQLTKQTLKVNGFYHYDFDETITIKIKEVTDIAEIEEYLSMIELFTAAWPNVKDPFNVITRQVDNFKNEKICELTKIFEQEVKDIKALNPGDITQFIVSEWISDAQGKLL